MCENAQCCIKKFVSRILLSLVKTVNYVKEILTLDQKLTLFYKCCLQTESTVAHHCLWNNQ